jgi:hypothetical protein
MQAKKTKTGKAPEFEIEFSTSLQIQICIQRRT